MKLILALAALALVPSTAAAAPTLFDHPKGSLSTPTNLHTSAGCVDRDTFVWPMQNPDGTRSVLAEVTEYDHCGDQVLLDHVGFTDTLTRAELAIASDLTSASLVATIPMNDALDEAFPPTDPLAVDLSWTGIGRQDRTNVLYENGHHDGLTVINHDHETCRDATVSGTVSDGSTDYAAGAVVDSRLCRQIGGSLFLFIE
jgi:hypothetical protein